MIRKHSNCYYYFRKQEDNRLDFDYFHPDFDAINNLDELTDYDIVCLGDIIKNIKSGTTPRGMKYIDEGINFLGATNISEYGIDLTEVKKIDESYHNNQLSNSKLEYGDILITMAGTIGRTALFEYDEPMNINQAIAKLEIDDLLVLGEFLVKYLNSHLGILFFKKYQHGVGQPNINLEEIKRIKVILPPLDIQKNIMEKVNFFENKANYYNEIKPKPYDILNDIFLTKFNLNVVENDFYLFKTDNTFTEMFYIFSDELDNRVDFSYYHHEDILKSLRNKDFILLKEICKKEINTGIQPKYSDSGKIVIRTKDLQGQEIIFEDNVFVSEEFFNSYPKAHAHKDDLIVSGTGYGSIGRTNVFDSENSVFIDPQLLIVSLNENFNPYFIKYYLDSYFGQIQFDKFCSGSSGQLHLYPIDLGNFLVPNIPLEEQNDLVITISKEFEKFNEYNKEFKNFWKKSEDTFLNSILKNNTF